MKIWLQKIIPQHAISRFMGKLGNSKNEFFKNWMIKKFIATYHVNMSEALVEQPEHYTCFNAFFTRQLKRYARDFNKSSNAILSPADGSVSELGVIKNGQLLQAKGVTYSLEALFSDKKTAALFSEGVFATIYLSPKDYHRVHMPFTGTLKRMIYVPGSLFSVNQESVTGIPGVFSKNERVIALFDTAIGPMAIIFVGALIVGSIYTTWHGRVTPQSLGRLTEWDYEPQQLVYQRGDDIGFFQMGSTVIVLFEKEAVQLESTFRSGSSVRLGDVLGTQI